VFVPDRVAVRTSLAEVRTGHTGIVSSACPSRTRGLWLSTAFSMKGRKYEGVEPKGRHEGPTCWVSVSKEPA
jgi:hypothetical protein